MSGGTTRWRLIRYTYGSWCEHLGRELLSYTAEEVVPDQLSTRFAVPSKPPLRPTLLASGHCFGPRVNLGPSVPLVCGDESVLSTTTTPLQVLGNPSSFDVAVTTYDMVNSQHFGHCLKHTLVGRGTCSGPAAQGWHLAARCRSWGCVTVQWRPIRSLHARDLAQSWYVHIVLSLSTAGRTVCKNTLAVSLCGATCPYPCVPLHLNASCVAPTFALPGSLPAHRCGATWCWTRGTR